MKNDLKQGVFALFLALALAGCQETEISELDIRNGRAYKKGTQTPFSGGVVAYFPVQDKTKEKRRIFQEGDFVSGRKSGLWVTYKWNGGREEAAYERGVRHGITKWYYTRRRLKQEQRYAQGMKHGEGALYDSQGQVLKKFFYSRDRLIPPPHDRLKGIEDLRSFDAESGGSFIEKLMSVVTDVFKK